jgi:alkyl sulfatase BDS1-like metallo-beta-lactamase superfamily hydrolase
MNFYFPDHHALCMAENTTHTLHNILTIRGAVVRDAHAWGHYITETLSLWAEDLDVCSPPTIGRPGAANGAWSTSQCNATCTSICMTRPSR